MAAGRTLSGPHRSDLGVIHAPTGMPASDASTGQQKALLIGEREQRVFVEFDNAELVNLGIALDRQGKSKEAYLFDRTGALKDGMPLFGSTLFSVGDMNQDGYQELVIGSEDGILYCYSLN